MKETMFRQNDAFQPTDFDDMSQSSPNPSDGVSFRLPDMSCGHCVGAVTKAVRSIDPASAVSVDLPSKMVRINSTASAARLAEVLTDAGYAPE